MGFLRIVFGWSGRVDRTTFLAAFGLLSLFGGLFFLLNGALTAVAPKLGLTLTVLWFPVSAWSALAINVKRLRDMGRSPAFAFLPMGLAFLAVIIALPGLIAAMTAGSGAGVIAALLGGGLVIILSSVTSFGLLLWLVFAATSPNAMGERLSPFGAGAPDRGAAQGSALALDAALQSALGQRAATAQPRLALSAAPALARGSGLPSRPTGGGFGRRR